jgi:hypothetical protein
MLDRLSPMDEYMLRIVNLRQVPVTLPTRFKRGKFKELSVSCAWMKPRKSDLEA